MSHLLLIKKHRQLLLKNVESRPTMEVDNNATSIGLVGLVVLDGPVTFVVVVVAADNAIVELYVAETSRRPTRGSFHKSQSKLPRYVVRKMHHKPKTLKPEHFKSSCHKCGR